MSHTIHTANVGAPPPTGVSFETRPSRGGKATSERQEVWLWHRWTGARGGDHIRLNLHRHRPHRVRSVPMTSPLSGARPRRAAVLVGALLATLLSPGLTSAPAEADHAGAEPGPIHAATTYGWWNKGIVWREEFEAPYTGQMGPQWQASGPGQVWHQNGMLTLNATSEGSLTATLAGPGAEVGRWETRLRSRQYGHGNARYRVLAELVPAAGAEENCGGRNISLVSYTPNGQAATSTRAPCRTSPTRRPSRGWISVATAGTPTPSR